RLRRRARRRSYRASDPSAGARRRHRMAHCPWLRTPGAGAARARTGAPSPPPTTAPALAEGAGRMPLPATLTNVSLDAPSGHVILSDVSLEVRAGDRTVVAGPSGAGKTSLLELVCGLRKPAAGTVELFGEPLRRPEKLPPRARRRIAYLFQAPERLFFRATLREEFDAALTDRGIAPSD